MGWERFACLKQARFPAVPSTFTLTKISSCDKIRGLRSIAQRVVPQPPRYPICEMAPIIRKGNVCFCFCLKLQRASPSNSPFRAFALPIACWFPQQCSALSLPFCLLLRRHGLSPTLPPLRKPKRMPPTFPTFRPLRCTLPHGSPGKARDLPARVSRRPCIKPT